MKAYIRYSLAVEGLASANKGNVFWSRSLAMSTLNITRNNIKAYSEARTLARKSRITPTAFTPIFGGA